jgi:hypothetical protein
MTRKEIVDVVMRLDVQGQQQWMVRLGSEFTISARAGYSVGKIPETSGI